MTLNCQYKYTKHTSHKLYIPFRSRWNIRAYPKSHNIYMCIISSVMLYMLLCCYAPAEMRTAVRLSCEIARNLSTRNIIIIIISIHTTASIQRWRRIYARDTRTRGHARTTRICAHAVTCARNQGARRTTNSIERGSRWAARISISREKSIYFAQSVGRFGALRGIGCDVWIWGFLGEIQCGKITHKLTASTLVHAICIYVCVWEAVKGGVEHVNFASKIYFHVWWEFMAHYIYL